FGEYKALVSHPALTNQVTTCCLHDLQEEGLQFHSVCGAPYTALPLATVICSRHELPMVIRRKEAKDYGTKRLVEGSFRQGDTCLIIEDTVTSGTSILETAEVLCKEGLKVTDAVVLMDREQGGVEMLASKGIKLHPIISISQLLRVLQAAERIDAQTAQSVHRFIQDNNRYNFTEFPPSGAQVFTCVTSQSRKIVPGFQHHCDVGPLPKDRWITPTSQFLSLCGFLFHPDDQTTV
uniref:Uridine monophosphate synthetase n=1 Tax=Oreochromis niloticus TaxID=8128 RepID=A0A669CW55_ORENI